MDLVFPRISPSVGALGRLRQRCYIRQKAGIGRRRDSKTTLLVLPMAQQHISTAFLYRMWKGMSESSSQRNIVTNVKAIRDLSMNDLNATCAVEEVVELLEGCTASEVCNGSQID